MVNAHDILSEKNNTHSAYIQNEADLFKTPVWVTCCDGRMRRKPTRLLKVIFVML